MIKRNLFCLLLMNKILENQKNLTTKDIVNQEPKKGGETIGKIISC